MKSTPVRALRKAWPLLWSVAALVALSAPDKSSAQGRTLTAAGLTTGFQEPLTGATSFTPGAGQTELAWTNAGGVVQLDIPTGATNKALTFTSKSSAGANAFRTEAINITGIANVKLAVKLRAFTTSGTGFESGDNLRVYPEVSTNGTTFTTLSTVNDLVPRLVGSSGVDAILRTYGPGAFGVNPNPATYVEKSVVIANPTGAYKSIRVVIDATTDSSSETFVFDDVTVTIPVCKVNTSVGNVVRTVTDSNAPNSDTFAFSVVVTNELPGATGWTSTSDPARPSGNYSVANISFGPYPVSGGPKTLTFRDSANSACTQSVTVTPPARFAMGEIDIPGIVRDLNPPPNTSPTPKWINNPALRTISLTEAGSTQTLSSETLSLATITAPVFFSMVFEAHTDGSNGTNFEQADTFKAELFIVTNGVTSVVNLVRATTIDKNANGVLNGSGSTAGNYLPLQDELNLNNATIGQPVDSVFELKHTIPADASSVRLLITAVNNEASENYLLRAIRFTSVFVPPPDDDNDGQSNAAENLAGTDPDNPNSFFRIASLDQEIQLDDSGTRFRFVSGLFPSVSQRFYNVYYSSDLVTWHRDMSLNGPVTGNDEMTGFTVYFEESENAPVRYYQVHVRRDDVWPDTYP